MIYNEISLRLTAKTRNKIIKRLGCRAVRRHRRGRLTILLASFFTLASTGQFAAQPHASVTLIKAGRLLEPRTGNVLSPAAVLIENDKIKEVGSPSQVQADAPSGVRTIDLGNATLLPGLIDCHTHLLLDVIAPPEAEIMRRFNGEFVPGLLLAIVESPSKPANGFGGLRTSLIPPRPSGESRS